MKAMSPFYCRWTAFMLLSVFLAIISCAAKTPAPDPLHEAYALNQPTVIDFQPPQPVEPEYGSLWVDDGPLSRLYVSRKARQAGDILTVSIVESATAANNADTKTERKSDISAGVDKFFNVEQRYPASRSPQSFPYLNPLTELKAGISSSFDGKGTTRRSGKLAASISVRVTKVLSNGNLAIAGFREITVNNEQQYITLSGIIRPEDISADNVVQSTYISDARITYSGVGVLNDRQRPGWITRIIDFIWPF